MGRERLFTFCFANAVVAKFFSGMVFYLCTTTIAAYVVFRYNLDAGAAGMAVGVFILVSVVGRVVSAKCEDVVGRKRTLVLSSALFLLLTACYLVPVGYGLFLLLRGLHGLAFGVYSNTVTVVGTSLVPHARRGEGLSYVALSTTVASALASAVGVALVQHDAFSIVFMANVLFAALQLVSVLLLRKDAVDVRKTETMTVEAVKARAEETFAGDAGASEGDGDAWQARRVGEERRGKREARKRNRFALSEFVEVSAVPASSLMLLACVCYAGSVTPFIGLYAVSLDIPAYASLYFVLYTVVLVAFRPLAGRLLDTKGANAAVYPSLVCMLGGFVALAVFPSAAGIVAGALLLALGYGCLFSSVQTVAVNASADDRLGFSTSTYYVFADFGTGIGPAVMGLVQAQAGFSGMYACAAAGSLACFALYTLVSRKAARQQARLRGR